jgi:phospholipid/cholesterol/gamma-HCH transport system substrate-binding protein
MADTFKRRSATFMEDGRRTLLDVSEAANRMGSKAAPQSAASPLPGPRRPQPKRP